MTTSTVQPVRRLGVWNIAAVAFLWVVAGLLAAWGTGGGLSLGLVVLAAARGGLHAMDADHLCMIDGSTRKLLGEGRNAGGVGLAFSLGHSTVVLAAGIAVVAGAGWVRRAIDPDTPLAAGLGAFGASVSAAYLLAVAAANGPTLVAALRGEPSGHSHHPQGPWARALRAPLSRVRHAGHVYLFGVLFGLGFDTASTISLLMITAAATLSGAPVVTLLALPVAFTAAMTLGDSVNAAVMRRVYAAADHRARRRLNVALLSLSIVAAVAVATVTLTELVAEWWGVGAPEVDTAPWGWALAGVALAGAVWLAWLRLRTPRRVARDSDGA